MATSMNENNLSPMLLADLIWEKKMNTEQKLNRLFGLQSELFSTFKEEHDRIADYKSRIIEIERQISESSTELKLEIDRIESEIIKETLEQGVSEKGDYLQAIYTKGSVTFDSKRFKVEQPSLYNQFSKEGNPRVRITAVTNETKKAV